MNNSPEISQPNRLRSLAESEKPQERLQRLGVAALSDTELLAMLLRSGTKGHDVLTLATRLLAEAGSLATLITWSDSDFKRLKGIGRVKALQLVTVVEIARRILVQERGAAPLLETASEVSRFLRPLAQGLAVEKLWVLCLNRKNRLIKCVEISSGTASASLVHPREVFREAIRESASGIVCAHNHPSGDPAPSAADIKATQQLRQAADTVQIPLLDHVIIGAPESDPCGRGFYSFREAGVIG